ncbi:cohesin complex subunit SA-1/2 [Sporothrix brasiliensis 5110]|uniref:Cohesin complex subunit SA-1/2 n=1 Tax=Sporothrix brasiliensis 5110 TaxID=1398154 RepID=A0A0C2F7B2_9PEZI|nr:cohesin complex subunit SA-1/2 [Sporothrix brasiliensis 5110]KIH86953.1 cohesin complex subunit SA-1/2 [Sporothrix brasiliensis 5110]
MADVLDDSAGGGDAASQRRSGRVVRAPARFLPEVVEGRKRPGDDGGHDDDDDVDDVDAEDGDDDDGEDGEANPRRVRPKRKANGASTAGRAIKKPKLNGAGNHAASLPSRPKKSVRVTIETDADHDSALYADIFSSGDDSDDVAGRWYERYQTNNQAAVADLVNCILSAAGCDYHVTEDDINDPDNCSNRLTELQGIYEDQKITDYPLIAKSRTTRSFRELLVQFFHSFISVLHETEMLYTQPEIMENVVRWVASLSSSTLRPFRHTATTVALAMLAALVTVARKLDDRINKLTQQVENQRSRNGKSKSKDPRLVSLENTLREAGGNRERAAELMKEFFDTVFVHRYRDVDPRIRTECVEALGSWVWALPAVYMQPEYLRYLGWMLSDSYPATRQEVLKQLARVFKRDASKMGHFIDRFRARLIEMATKDADISVRVSAIAVVEQLRPAGLLEPDEIDSIGQLIFDAEIRIRRAAVNFFADCVREFASIKLDEVGGEEVMYELFGKGQSKTGDFDAPRRDWINVKSLANTVSAYETQLGAQRTEPTVSSLDVTAEVASAVVPETSRLALATQVLVDKIPEITNWEILAGYLLYDHSVDQVKGRGGRKQTRTADATFRVAVAPGDNEEAILLEILAAAAKASLAPGGESERFKKRFGRPDAAPASAATGALSAAESSEAAALQLATLIPQLLRKFGAEPATAVTVLRLQHSLNLEVFRQLRQDTATFEGLLDEICTQFTRHADTAVVAEAAAALLHARQYEELEEVVDSRVSSLWETTINSLRNFDRTCELSARRSLSPALASQLSVTLFKINKLAAISDSVDILEARGTANAESESPAIEILVKTVHRGKFEEPDEDLDNIEDGLTANAIGACQFYFMWKMRSLVLAVNAKAEISNPVIDNLAILKRAFDQNVVHTFSSRGYNDDLRLYATGAYCDLHVLFAQLRKNLDRPAVMARYVSLGRLIDQVPPGLIGELVSIFDAAERSFAKKAKKTLNDPADDEDPVEDPLDEDDDDDDDDEDTSIEERRAAELKAERALCDLTSHYVMAIVARVLDHSGPFAGKLKRRLLRNQTKLGHSYKEIVAFLDENKAGELLVANSRKKGGHAARGGTTKGKVAAAASDRPGTADAGGALSAPTPGATHEEVLLGAPTPAADLDDDELDDLLDTPEPEEGTVEDLRRRELIDQGLDDEEEEDDDKAEGMDEDEDILGD